MTDAAASKPTLRSLISPHRTEIDVAARPSDGLVVFTALWGLATIFSIAANTHGLSGQGGLTVALSQWMIIGLGLVLIARPGQTWLLGVLAGVMAMQYLYRSPVTSNNQTLAFFMNSSIVLVLLIEIVRSRSIVIDRDFAYERLRVVARALLAVMYFYGLFHKINSDFLNPTVSCAVALYEPLTRPFGLDQNIVGRYGAIIITFVAETIALVALYWRRYFWIGLILGLVFHYIIPISAYSWYMDFSSLVLALYMLSMPREVSAGFYSTAVALLRKLPTTSPGDAAIFALLLLFAASALLVVGIAQGYPPRALTLLWHSSWLVVWAVVGGIVMVLVTRAALLELPYAERPTKRQPAWLLVLPATLALTGLSPYLGLKTESSIAMFSNLHTEGGQTNHLLFASPPYIAPYQSSLTRIVESNDWGLQQLASKGGYMVEYQLASRLRSAPDVWVTVEKDGQFFERVTGATIDYPFPSPSERKFLAFKDVDFVRPKVCSH